MVIPQSFQCEIGGRILVIETGKLAGQATAAVTVRYGDTVVLVTACVSDEPREGVDFLPLTIDYEERLYAAGKIPGGFIRREGRPSQEATLASRLTDRPLRPLLPKTWRRDIQLIITVLSADQENDPNILSVIGSSAVLTLSEIPFEGPVSAVNIGFINNELVVNPTLIQLEQSQLDLVVASTKEAVIMVEAGAREVTEDLVTRAISLGHQVNQSIIAIQEEILKVYGKDKVPLAASEVIPEIVTQITETTQERIDEILELSSKTERETKLLKLRKELVDNFSEHGEDEIFAGFDKVFRNQLRFSILDKGQRVGGRGLTEVRSLNCEVGLLPRTHGSALFTRGLTQVLTIATLGSTRQEQQLDGLGIEESKRFLHHYNFPPFSVGEVRRIGSPGRREIGHGALAERALLPVIPNDEVFPYTIRLVSEVLSSSGSTSMASVCASSMTLMDAGIPVKTAVAGIAMGLVTDDRGNFAVLTDIEGIEDNYGDMDYKVAGTKDGITALQMDTKLKGISLEILEKTLYQAREARLFILNTMNETISTNRPEISRYAPRMYKMMINPEKIGSVIGPKGKTIRSIIEETKTTIDIEDDGTVIIGSQDEETAQKAMRVIEGLIREVEVGNIYTGKVTRILNFGAMVEILPGQEGLVHISELADYRVTRVEDIIKVGDELTVKVINIDNLGRINLSRKAVFENQSTSDKNQVKEQRLPRRTPRPSFGRSPKRKNEHRRDSGKTRYPKRS